jgi:hypothetical protein
MEWPRRDVLSTRSIRVPSCRDREIAENRAMRRGELAD